MLEKICASAPNSVFLFGEIGFDWGARALAVPADFSGKRNTVSLMSQEGIGRFVVYCDERMAMLDSTGRVTGDESVRPYVDGAKKLLSSAGLRLDGLEASLAVTIDYSGAPDGTGRHAAACTALCLALFEFMGIERDDGALLDAIYAFESGFSSGQSEAHTLPVFKGSAQLLRREFLLDGSVRVRPSDFDFSLPSSTCMVYADASDGAKPSQSLSAALARARGSVSASGRVKAPRELTPAERGRIIDDFDSVTDRFRRGLSGGDPVKIGSFLDLGQALLDESGLVSKKAGAAVQAAKSAGAFGAKSSGYCGGVVALCREQDAEKVASSMAACGARASRLFSPAAKARLERGQ